jgi:hypothetical protein
MIPGNVPRIGANRMQRVNLRRINIVYTDGTGQTWTLADPDQAAQADQIAEFTFTVEAGFTARLGNGHHLFIPTSAIRRLVMVPRHTTASIETELQHLVEDDGPEGSEG